ncbi:hypothetical protein O0L34_g13014 [Tuta absoluta]|nr:hypothetical protein O0L34_g13014 [Tuta absoluta]
MENSFFEYRDRTGAESASDSEVIDNSLEVDDSFTLLKTPAKKNQTAFVAESEESSGNDEFEEDVSNGPKGVPGRSSLAVSTIVSSSDDDTNKRGSIRRQPGLEMSFNNVVLSSSDSDEEQQELSPEIVPKRRPPQRPAKISIGSDTSIIGRKKNKRIVLQDSDTENSIIIEHNKNKKMVCLKDTPVRVDDNKMALRKANSTAMDQSISYTDDNDDDLSNDIESNLPKTPSRIKNRDELNEIDDSSDNDVDDKRDKQKTQKTKINHRKVSNVTDDSSDSDDDERKKQIHDQMTELTKKNKTPNDKDKHKSDDEYESAEDDESDDGEQTEDEGPDEDQLVYCRATRMSIMGVIPKGVDGSDDDSDFIQSDEKSRASSALSLNDLPDVTIAKHTEQIQATPSLTPEKQTVDADTSRISCSPFGSPLHDITNEINQIEDSYEPKKQTLKQHELKSKVITSDLSKNNYKENYDDDVTFVSTSFEEAPKRTVVDEDVMFVSSNQTSGTRRTYGSANKKSRTPRSTFGSANQTSTERVIDDDITIVESTPEVIALSSDDEDELKPKKSPSIKKSPVDQSSSRKDGTIKQYLVPPSYPNQQVVYVKKHVRENELSKLQGLKEDLHNIKYLLENMDMETLPDGGVKLIERLTGLERLVRQQGEMVANMVVEPDMPSADDMAKDGFDAQTGLSWEQLQKGSQAVQPRMFGKQAMATHMAERNLILERLRDLHASLASRPPETQLAAPPRAVRSRLMQHQLHALAWLRWRETQRPKGGILADDMGLGKTITMISLVVSDKDGKLDDSDDDDEGGRGISKLARGGTLVVCPASLMQQWSGEVTKHCTSHAASVCLHHGAQRATHPHRLATYDIVLTTYNILQRDNEKVTKHCTSHAASVCLHHGAQRATHPHRLATYDIVLTTYNILQRDNEKVKCRGGEVTKHCTSHAVSVCLHHGAQRATHPHRLATYDIVLTTYNILQRDNEKNGVLMKVLWRRIILDEAHIVRNHKSATSTAVSALKGSRRWCLTGTPVQNKDLDLFALLKFLRCTPFDELTMWKKWIDNKSQGGSDRLSTIMQCILLRRTKVQLQEKGQLNCLPERTTHLEEVTLTKEEMNVYQKVLVFSKTLFAQFLHQRAEKQTDMQGLATPDKNSAYDKMHKKMVALQGAKPVKSHEILVLLLRLRQVCCHCGLIAAMLDEETAGDAVDMDPGGQDLLAELNKLSIEDKKNKRKSNEPDHQEEEGPPEEGTSVAEAIRSVLSPSNPVFQLSRQSSKIKAVMDCLHQNVFANKGHKAVVVSQWTSVLRLVEKELANSKIRCVTLSGNVPVPHRPPIIDKLNDPTSDVKVSSLIKEELANSKIRCVTLSGNVPVPHRPPIIDKLNDPTSDVKVSSLIKEELANSKIRCVTLSGNVPVPHRPPIIDKLNDPTSDVKVSSLIKEELANSKIRCVTLSGNVPVPHRPPIIDKLNDPTSDVKVSSLIKEELANSKIRCVTLSGNVPVPHRPPIIDKLNDPTSDVKVSSLIKEELANSKIRCVTLSGNVPVPHRPPIIDKLNDPTSDVKVSSLIKEELANSKIRCVTLSGNVPVPHRPPIIDKLNDPTSDVKVSSLIKEELANSKIRCVTLSGNVPVPHRPPIIDKLNDPTSDVKVSSLIKEELANSKIRCVTLSGNVPVPHRPPIIDKLNDPTSDVKVSSLIKEELANSKIRCVTLSGNVPVPHRPPIIDKLNDPTSDVKVSSLIKEELANSKIRCVTLSGNVPVPHRPPIIDKLNDPTSDVKVSSLIKEELANSKIRCVTLSGNVPVPHRPPIIDKLNDPTSDVKVSSLIKNELANAKIRCFTLSGNVPVPHRPHIIDKLNDPTSDVKVMLLSLCAGGVGLNLCGANHLLLLDPHWNPQLEEQAQDRIYRVGQTKPVHIYRFMCVETVEQSIRNLQLAKLQLAENVLTGAKNTNNSKLTIEDLKMLFNMGTPQE